MTNRDANQYNRLLLALCGEIAARLRGMRRPRWSSLDKAFRVGLAMISFLTLSLTVMHREDADGYQATHLFFMPRMHWEMDQGRGMLYEPDYYSRMDEAILLEEVSGARFITAFESEGYYDEYEEYGEYEIMSLPLPEPSAERTAAYHEWLAHAQLDYTMWFAHTRAAFDEWLTSHAQAFDSWLARQPDSYRAAYEMELAGQKQNGSTEGAEIQEQQNNAKPTQGGTVRRAPHAPAFGSHGLPIDSANAGGAIISWQYETLGFAYARPLLWRDDTVTPPPRA